MTKKILSLFTLCFLLSVSLSAQKNSKMNAALARKTKQSTNEPLNLLIKGNVSFIESFLKNNGGVMKYSSGNIASITIPADKVKELAMNPKVERMEYTRNHFQVLDDSSLSKNNIVKIHNGIAPLPQAYTGKGVVFGVIDTGLDFNHPDFKDTAGKTRVQYLWDQRSGASPLSPQPYNYGNAWSKQQIDSGLCTHADNANVGHGTKVTGVAAGNGVSAAQYKGIAPEADIIAVALDFSSTGPVMTDAINYIFAMADSLHEPCVINISIGDYYGSHDGVDLQAQMIDTMTMNIPGRAIVVAAGNSGANPIHLGYSVNATDTNFTWVSNASNQIYFQVYSDTADFKGVHYTMGVSDTNLNYKGNIGFKTIDTCLNIFTSDTLKYNGNHIGIVETYGSLYGGTYELEILLTPDSLSYLWSLEATGTGKFDSWSPDFVHNGLPSAATLPRMNLYKNSDTTQTVCTSYQCSDQIITVGNYVDRNDLLDINDTLRVLPGVNDSIFTTSSRGPTRDGRTKPDIAASGENIITTGTLPWLAWLTANFPFVVTKDSLHMEFNGTSAASPVVAGFVALYLQKNPTATNQMIKQDITNCSKQDAYTGATPNNLWGYGKLDGYHAMLCGYSPVGIVNTANNDDLSVYPNPTNSEITIACKAGINTIAVYDIQGKMMLNRKGNVTQLEKINLNALPEGLYLLRLTTVKGEVKQFKVVKQN